MEVVSFSFLIPTRYKLNKNIHYLLLSEHVRMIVTDKKKTVIIFYKILGTSPET